MFSVYEVIAKLYAIFLEKSKLSIVYLYLKFLIIKPWNQISSIILFKINENTEVFFRQNLKVLIISVILDFKQIK